MQVRTFSQTIMSRQTSLLSRNGIPPCRDQGLEWIEDPRFAFPFLLRKGGYGYVASLLVLLHDAGENEQQLAGMAGAIAEGVAVVMPRACIPLRRGAFAWDMHGAEATSAEFRSSVEGVVGFIRTLQAWLGVDASRTAIAGFGQGGTLGAAVALCPSECVSGLGLLASRWPAVASREGMRYLHAFIGHGVLDEGVPVEAAGHAAVQLARHRAGCTQRRYLAKHELTPQMRGDFVEWFNASWLDRTVLASPLASAGGGLWG